MTRMPLALVLNIYSFQSYSLAGSTLCLRALTSSNPVNSCYSRFDELVKSHKPVTPAKAGFHNILEYLDSRFRGNDKNGAKRTFYERIIFK